MVKILILGGGGMVGQKLVKRIADGGLNGARAEDITLFDIGFPPNPIKGTKLIKGSLTDPKSVSELASENFDIIFHLASVVSGEAETDFTKGWSVNMTAMWQLLEALREAHLASGGSYRPKLIFTSSIAVFGAPFPERIGDTFFCAPQTSYGAQKHVCEMLIGDFSRKGFVDGLSLRLPTICVRPGKPNLAASSFFSGIIREPLNGQTAILPVPDTVRHWHASPRSAARFLTHAAGLNFERLEERRVLNLPGLSCTVAEQIDALRNAAGQEVVDKIMIVPDPDIMAIVKNWPENFEPTRALELGFRAEQNFEEIIQVYLEDDFQKSD